MAATSDNAKNSILEPGIARFELLQSDLEPTDFVLAEAYYSAEDQANHKDTAHFKKWVETVNHMMAAPRKAVKFKPIFPIDKYP